MDKEKVIVIDFGGQYNQLVARRVRECNVYCEIYSYRTDIETIKAMNPKGIILTGGPNSCYEADAIQKANSGHPGLPLGAAGFTHVLWSQVLNHDAKHPEWINRDRFILSAGHGSSMLYSSCATLSRAFWISSLILRAFLWSRPLAVIPTTSPSSI